jgi:hypothetical protein
VHICFVDESQGHRDRKWLVAAGYIATEEVWANFDRAWRDVLAAPPTVASMHMVDAWSFTGDFVGWEVSVRDEKLTTLARLIETHGLRSFSASLSVQCWNDTMLSVGPYELREPYFMVFHTAISAALKLITREGGAGTKFVFDEKGDIGRRAAMWYREMLQHQPADLRSLVIGPPIFVADEQHPAVQAADMLAWQLRRSLDGQTSPFDVRGCTHVEMPVGDEVIADLAHRMSGVPGVELTRGKQGAMRRRAEIERRLSMDLGPPLTELEHRWRWLLFRATGGDRARRLVRKWRWKLLGK